MTATFGLATDRSVRMSVLVGSVRIVHVPEQTVGVVVVGGRLLAAGGVSHRVQTTGVVVPYCTDALWPGSVKLVFGRFQTFRRAMSAQDTL